MVKNKMMKLFLNAFIYVRGIYIFGCNKY